MALLASGMRDASAGRGGAQAGHREAALRALAPCLRCLARRWSRVPAHEALVGATPLILLERLSGMVHPSMRALVFVKAEHLSPGGSFCDRIAVRVAKEAPKECGVLAVSEATGGEAVSLAMAVAPHRKRVYAKASAQLPDGTRRMLEALGAECGEAPHADSWDADAAFAHHGEAARAEVRREIREQLAGQSLSGMRIFFGADADGGILTPTSDGRRSDGPSRGARSDRALPLSGLSPDRAMAWLATNEGILVSPRTAATIAAAAAALAAAASADANQGTVAAVVVAHETGERYINIDS